MRRQPRETRRRQHRQDRVGKIGPPDLADESKGIERLREARRLWVEHANADTHETRRKAAEKL